MEKISPYATPESLSETRERDPEDLYTDGIHLVCPQKAILPFRCIKTGETMGNERKTEVLLGLPWWLHASRMIFFPLYLMLTAFSQNRCKIEFSYQPQVNRKRQWACATLGVFMLVTGNLIAVNTPSNWNWHTYLAISLISSGLSFISEARHRLWCSRNTHGWYFVSGCSPQYLGEFPRLESQYGSMALPSNH